MAFLNKAGLERLWTHIVSQLNRKVEKVDGMGLSTNDFTTDEKEKLANLSLVSMTGNYNDLLNKPEIPSIEGLATENYVNDVVTERVDTEIAELVNSAPETLDTLGELADALQDNRDIVDILNSAITNKADKADVASKIHTHVKAEITDLEDTAVSVTDDNNGNVTIESLSGTQGNANISEQINEAIADLVSYSKQEPTEEQQAQARVNLDVDYATDEEIIAMMLAEGIEVDSVEQATELYVDDNGDGTLNNATFVVDENNNATTNAKFIVNENGDAIIEK